MQDSKNIIVSQATLTKWAESCLRMNGLGTLVQRELADGNSKRAAALAERTRVRAWELFNEVIESGALKPEGYRELEKVD